MANRRMFSPDIVATDAFIEMPATAQLLYFHLGMRADDDGFVNPVITMRIMGANGDDLKILVGKRFVLPFDNGVVVIKHWRQNNYLRKDRYKPTNYQEQKAQLYVKNNGAYTLDESKGTPANTTDWVRDSQRYTSGTPAVHVGKVRLGKVRLGKETITTAQSAKKYTYTKEDTETVDLFIKLIQTNYPDWQMRGSREQWADTINKLHRIDGRTYEQITYMVKWVQADEFWRQNILSPTKLRQKFNDLIPRVQAAAVKRMQPSKPKMI